MITGARTREAIVEAFRTLNPTFTLTPAQISPVSLQLLNLRNPVTGDYILPAPQGVAAGTDRRVAMGAFGTIGGDPLAEQRQVVPAEFQQIQGSIRTDFRTGCRRTTSTAPTSDASPPRSVGRASRSSACA